MTKSSKRTDLERARDASMRKHLKALGRKPRMRILAQLNRAMVAAFDDAVHALRATGYTEVEARRKIIMELDDQWFI